jgi:quercetin dioxygenase-like cupin family protein
MKPTLIAALLAALPLAAAAQDPVKVDGKHYKLVLDNAAVRVLKISYGVGEKSPMHAHPDAILVPLAHSKASFTMADGKIQAMDVVSEVANYTPAMTHAPANVGSGVIDALLVEIKPKTGAAAKVPTARPGMAMKPLAEGPGGVAYRSTLAADFQEAAGSTHEFDQIVVALGSADIMLAVEGRPPVTKWQRGDVQFIGRGVKHESKNNSGKPVDVVIVALK